VVFPDFYSVGVSEEQVCIDPFRQNPVFTSLHLGSPVHTALVTEDFKEFKMYRKGKTSEKRDIKILSFQICVETNLSATSWFCLRSFCFWGEVSTS
jgi:hypothetical protein